MSRAPIVLAILFALGFGGRALAFYDLQQYARDRTLARTDPHTRATLDARLDGIASGLFTANGLYADGLYREGFFCLPYDITLTVKDFYDLLDRRLTEYRHDGIYEQVKGQSAAATIVFELRRRYPCGRDRGDPFPSNYVFPDGTPAWVYKREMEGNQARTGPVAPPASYQGQASGQPAQAPAYPAQTQGYRNLAPQYRTQTPASPNPVSPGRPFSLTLPMPSPTARSQ